jgi:hypothetical protein
MKTYSVEKYIHEETSDYGKVGEVEWYLMYGDECVEVYPLKRMAAEVAKANNAYLAKRAA